MFVNKMKVERINNLYVSDDCCQIMLPSMNNITILSKDGIIYHRNELTPFYINKYLEDCRRNIFPYSSIPEHNKFIFPNKIRFVNQVLNYDDVYYAFGTGYGKGMELCVLKDKESAIFVKRFIQNGKCSQSYKKLDELESLFTGYDDEIVYNITLDGIIIRDRVVPSKDEIIDSLRIHLILQNINDDYFYLDYYDFKNIQLDIALLDNPIINVRIKDNKIFIKKISIYMIELDKYYVVEEDIPVNKYNLEWIKNINVRTNNTFDVKISRLINPDIPYEDIEMEKNKVKKINRIK